MKTASELGSALLPSLRAKVSVARTRVSSSPSSGICTGCSRHQKCSSLRHPRGSFPPLLQFLKQMSLLSEALPDPHLKLSPPQHSPVPRSTVTIYHVNGQVLRKYLFPKFISRGQNHCHG